MEEEQQNTSSLKKSNTYKILFIIVLVLIGLYLIWVGFNYVSSSYYNSGYQRGALVGINQLIDSQLKNSIIYYYSNQTGNMSLQSIAIQQVCRNLAQSSVI